MLFVDEDDTEEYDVPIEVSSEKDKKADKVMYQMESCVDIVQRYVVKGESEVRADICEMLARSKNFEEQVYRSEW